MKVMRGSANNWLFANVTGVDTERLHFLTCYRLSYYVFYAACNYANKRVSNSIPRRINEEEEEQKGLK
ncbi:MAG: hypothetical protein ACJ71P_08745, partial [Nitrososphaeraceae archaeon]